VTVARSVIEEAGTTAISSVAMTSFDGKGGLGGATVPGSLLG